MSRLVVRVENDVVTFSDPTNPSSSCSVEFQRTLRIPDDNKVYPLPSSLGKFPVHKVDDFPNTVPSTWKQHGGVFLPMYQREAMWIKLNGVKNYPKAMKIGVGKVNAISGENWTQHININPNSGENWTQRINKNPIESEQDYIVIPEQPWIDGINAGQGYVKQFVAMPLGSGTTIESQVTGKEEFGGIQIMAFNAKEDRRAQKFPPFGFNTTRFSPPNQPNSIFGPTTTAPTPMVPFYSFAPQSQAIPNNLFGGNSSTGQGILFGSTGFNSGTSTSSFTFGNAYPQQQQQQQQSQAREMGMSAGGKIKQKILTDPYGADFWDQNAFGRVYVHIVNAEMYQKITGNPLPSTPITAQTYTNMGYPWYDIYDSDKNGVPSSNILSNVKTVKQIEQSNPFNFQWPQNDSSIDINQVKTTQPDSRSTIQFLTPTAPPLPTQLLFSNPVAKHEHVWCDNCKKTPIEGVRYKCANCVDYDLCPTCEVGADLIHDPTHVFIKVRKPINARFTSPLINYNLYITGTGPSFTF
jgi:hypothetical protein